MLKAAEKKECCFQILCKSDGAIGNCFIRSHPIGPSSLVVSTLTGSGSPRFQTESIHSPT